MQWTEANSGPSSPASRYSVIARYGTLPLTVTRAVSQMFQDAYVRCAMLRGRLRENDGRAY